MFNPFFMFATGIENSIPTINGGRFRVDEMETCRFYELWRTDFDLLGEIGIRFLRFGPPLHRTWLGPDRYDWEFADLTMNRLKELDIVPIVDLCHFGVPDWIGDFQNPDFPAAFADYAEDFARRLERRFKLPVARVDERFSSVEAETRLRGVKRKNIDSVAAQLLLEQYFDEAA